VVKTEIYFNPGGVFTRRIRARIEKNYGTPQEEKNSAFPVHLLFYFCHATNLQITASGSRKLVLKRVKNFENLSFGLLLLKTPFVIHHHLYLF